MYVSPYRGNVADVCAPYRGNPLARRSEAHHLEGLGGDGQGDGVARGRYLALARHHVVGLVERVGGVLAVGMQRDDLRLGEALGPLEGDGDLLRLVGGVGNLQDGLLGGLVVDGAGVETAVAGHGLAVLGELQHVGTLVGAVEHLHIPVG